MSENNWHAYCETCGDEQRFETEEGAVGWIFGHSLRTEHYDTKKEEL